MTLNYLPLSCNPLIQFPAGKYCASCNHATSVQREAEDTIDSQFLMSQSTPPSIRWRRNGILQLLPMPLVALINIVNPNSQKFTCSNTKKTNLRLMIWRRLNASLICTISFVREAAITRSFTHPEPEWPFVVDTKSPDGCRNIQSQNKCKSSWGRENIQKSVRRLDQLQR